MRAYVYCSAFFILSHPHPMKYYHTHELKYYHLSFYYWINLSSEKIKSKKKFFSPATLDRSLVNALFRIFELHHIYCYIRLGTSRRSCRDRTGIKTKKTLVSRVSSFHWLICSRVVDNKTSGQKNEGKMQEYRLHMLLFKRMENDRGC
jgi:hypothetical protein